MSRYNFVSPGAAAGNAIEQFLVQRALEDRQRRMEELAAQNTKADNARADEQLFRQQENDKRIASAQDDAARLTKAQAAAGSLGIGGRISPDDPNAGLISQYLPGVLDQDMTLASRHMTGAGIPGVMARTEDIAPQATGMMVSRGTAQQKQAAEAITAREREQADAREARAAEGEAARLAAGERARDSNDTRMTIAGMAAASRGEAANAAASARAERDRAKTEADNKDRADKMAGVAADRRSIRELAQHIKDSPILERITGPIDANTWTIRPDSVQLEQELTQIKNLIAIGARQKLKGSGAISNYEAQTLMDAEQAITAKAGAKNVREQLEKLVKAFAGDSPSEALSMAPSHGGGGRVPMVAPDGTRGTVPAEQVQQAIAKGYKPGQ